MGVQCTCGAEDAGGPGYKCTSGRLANIGVHHYAPEVQCTCRAEDAGVKNAPNFTVCSCL
jgi:hypothetical protein